ncbi:MAG: CPBP family intramembrane metalloprotease [Ignavibacteria bacterium]|nr:CPBP family intramembrane metalloprotease [Ignavibacteria bacterium]
MNAIHTIESRKKFKLLFIIAGYLILYGVLELAAKQTGDTGNTWNALLITACVLLMAILVEIFIFRRRFNDLLSLLGLGKPRVKAIAAALIITMLMFICYPAITAITGYQFRLPAAWLWLAIGVFVFHGIAEEVLYRAFLFRRLREGRSFWKAAWLAVIFFTAAHIPIIVNMGLMVGGMAVLLAVVSSFPFSYLYEKGGNTIWAPAIVHAAIDTIIPILAAGGMNEQSTMAVSVWMAAAMIIPYTAFLILKVPRKQKAG